MSTLVDGDVFRRLCRAREFARDRHATDVTIEAMARVAGMSPFHFARSFRRSFGQTPHAWLTDVRLDRAKTLLSRHGSHVTDVCFDVGFASLGSFSTLFARHVGLPPSVWQRRMVHLAACPGGIAVAFIPHCFASWFCSVGGG